MYQIKEEMKKLREKASRERLEMKKEERMASLQNERDWFRKEALELDKMVKDKNKSITQLKNQLENAEDDREWFHDQLMQTKKANKTLVWELERYQKALPPSERPSAGLPSPHQIIDSGKSSRRDVPKENKRNKDIIDNMEVDDENTEVIIRDEREIKAITDREHSQIQQEDTDGVSINNNAIVFRQSTNEEYNEYKSDADLESEISYTHGEILKIVKENK